MKPVKNDFHNLDRRDFRDRLDYFLHPSRHIELPKQLYGRERALSEMQDAFETAGSHPFIWGARGIGKTSLGHTACEEFNDQVSLAAAVACSKNTKFKELVDDILADAVHRRPKFFSDKKIKASLKGFGFEISTEIGGIQSLTPQLTVNQAASALDAAFSFSNFGKTTPVIIVDEFDRLRDQETFTEVADLLKQLSVNSSFVKFCFCGVTDDLGALLAAHESVERYIFGVQLGTLKHDDVWNLVRDIASEFEIQFERGQEIRIGQIAAGYPHFAHLILKNCLMDAYENGVDATTIPKETFRGGLNRSASQAATRLRTAYENAIRKGTDRYIEVLFAVANSEHLNRQFKDIVSDYDRIMLHRKGRKGFDTSKNNAQDLRNAMNSLVKRGYLKKGKTGWYQFQDPMLRSYVRLIAETEGVELSDDAFPN